MKWPKVSLFPDLITQHHTQHCHRAGHYSIAIKFLYSDPMNFSLQIKTSCCIMTNTHPMKGGRRWLPIFGDLSEQFRPVITRDSFCFFSSPPAVNYRESTSFNTTEMLSAVSVFNWFALSGAGQATNKTLLMNDQVVKYLEFVRDRRSSFLF